MSSRMFALIFGLVYLLLALLEGLLFKDVAIDTQFLFYGQIHNMLHWVPGVLGLIAYFGGENLSRLYTQIFGVVFFLVAILGFIPGQPILSDILKYEVNMLYNFIHLITGVFGVWAGFFDLEETD